MNKIKITFWVSYDKYQVETFNILDAYAAMYIEFNVNIILVKLYSPTEVLKDNWTLNKDKFFGLFGGRDSFNKYLQERKSEIEEVYLTIKRI